MLKTSNQLYPGLWTAILGFSPVESFFRQEKLLMAARLFVDDFKACKIFRGLLCNDRGSFEIDVVRAISEWSLEKLWENLTKDNILHFKIKVKRISKSHWPRALESGGQLSWLYHNHRVYSGNVPNWADWNWPKNNALKLFENHFICLLTGLHPAGGDEAVCCHGLCENDACDSVYNHHFFKCTDYIANRNFFKVTARRLFKESDHSVSARPPLSMLEDILAEPCPMWIGLVDQSLFKPGVKLAVIHELHRIVAMASIFSCGRYILPST